MKNNSYHLFLFLITFTRGLVETFSLVFLYNKGFMVKEILIFFRNLAIPNLRVIKNSIKLPYLGGLISALLI